MSEAIRNWNRAHDFAVHSISPGYSQIKLDGEDISSAVYGITTTQKPGEMPQVELRLKFYEMRYDGKAMVSIPEDTRAVLSALGWIPPGGASDDRDTGSSEGSPA